MVTFPKVKILSLEDLPKLGCFCSEANGFEWSSLEKIKVARCDRLKKFASAHMETPTLKGVHTGSEEFQLLMGDLNATIQNIIK